MSVDDRLRAGLEANAVDFLPEGEARLAQVHTRLRRRRAFQGSAAVASVAAAVAVIAVVSSSRPAADREEPVPQPTPTVTTSAYDGPRIPDSSWSRVLTRADAERAKLSEADIVRYLGADGRLPLTFQFETDAWSLLVTNDEGVAEVGDFGPLVYDAPGRLTMTSEAPGCPGCEYGLTWEIRGNRLILGLAPGESLPRADGFHMLGSWRRSD